MAVVNHCRCADPTYPMDHPMFHQLDPKPCDLHEGDGMHLWSDH